KKVVVIGGGPAGMEAARVAALRGHQVTLYDKQDKVGGQLLEAIVPPHKDNMKPFLDYLSRQMAKRGVDVRLGVEVDQRLMAEAKPEVTVLAAGVVTSVPQIKGIDGVGVLTAKEVLHGAEVGDTVVVIGGGLVGCETAEYLAMQHKRVTIVEMLDEVASVMPLALRKMLFARLQDMKVSVLTGVRCQEFAAGSLLITAKAGEEVRLAFDTVVIAAGGKPNQALMQGLRRAVPMVYCAGDCVEPRGIAEAMADGYRIGLDI
ncbi:MAG TPA: FAD-dependent oxidoreductase, partial [Dehalococcoidia bacterium]|nr:FAD-dependent oxidoreductase [Dehalococcoidia bacterium]